MSHNLVDSPALECGWTLRLASSQQNTAEVKNVAPVVELQGVRRCLADGRRGSPAGLEEVGFPVGKGPRSREVPVASKCWEWPLAGRQQESRGLQSHNCKKLILPVTT